MRTFELGKPWYRATIHVWHQIDAPRRCSLTVSKVEVLRTTDKGAWVREELGGQEKWVTPRTHWCSPTREAAIESLRIRKARHVGHARRRLADAELALDYLCTAEPKVSSYTIKPFSISDVFKG